MILTTGGTGPARRDVTPEATLDVIEKELPGFGEAQRALSFRTVPTAILSRAIAGVRGRSLIVNLPGNPKAIANAFPPLFRPSARPCAIYRNEHPAQREKDGKGGLGVDIAPRFPARMPIKKFVEKAARSFRRLSSFCRILWNPDKLLVRSC